MSAHNVQLIMLAEHQAVTKCSTILATMPADHIPSHSNVECLDNSRYASRRRIFGRTVASIALNK